MGCFFGGRFFFGGRYIISGGRQFLVGAYFWWEENLVKVLSLDQVRTVLPVVGRETCWEGDPILHLDKDHPEIATKVIVSLFVFVFLHLFLSVSVWRQDGIFSERCDQELSEPDP